LAYDGARHNASAHPVAALAHTDGLPNDGLASPGPPASVVRFRDAVVAAEDELEPVDVAGRRVTLRESTKEAILEAQRAPDGKLYDPNTR
jgi:hypothetical protein